MHLNMNWTPFTVKTLSKPNQEKLSIKIYFRMVIFFWTLEVWGDVIGVYVAKQTKTYSWCVDDSNMKSGGSICLNLQHPLAKHVKKCVRFLGSLSWIMNGKLQYRKGHTNKHTACSMCAGRKTVPHSGFHSRHCCWASIRHLWATMIWLNIWCGLSAQLCSEDRNIHNTNEVST